MITYVVEAVFAVLVWIVIYKLSKIFVESKPQRYRVGVRSHNVNSENFGLYESNPSPKKESWESLDSSSAIERSAQGRYNITYTDQDGIITKRDIDVKYVLDENGKFVIKAFCNLRKSNRNFFNTRIKKAIDLDTGEEIVNVAVNAIEQYQNSDEGRIKSAIEKEMRAIQLLIFVCRADGRMLKAERAIIIDYLKRHCSELPNDDVAIDNEIKVVEETDHRAFKRIVAELKKAGDKERLRDILDCSQRIVATGKTVDPMEKAAIEILEKACKYASE